MTKKHSKDKESSAKGIKICFTNIVKNESKIIQRMLERILLIVDYINICDTGSTDNTIDLIHEFLKDKNIPYKINNHEWKDFTTNRNLSLTSGKKNFPDADFLFTIDADMILQIDDNFDKNKHMSIDHHGYTIEQYNSDTSYQNLRFFNTRCDWVYKGRTHEVQHCKTHNTSQCPRLTQVRIHDIGDGGCKDDKFVRDKKLLLEDMREDPTNTRTYYYLGQTLQCLGEYDYAIKILDKRIQMRGWSEEVFMACLLKARCYKSKGEIEKALQIYLESYNLRPERLEGIYEYAQIIIDSKDKIIEKEEEKVIDNIKYMSLFGILQQALKTENSKNDLLFVSKVPHTWGIHYQMSIICFYLQKYDMGIHHSFKALRYDNLPEPPRRKLLENLNNYYFKVMNLENFSVQYKEIETDERKKN